ncbi:MAG: SAM-dependent methyltransferase, partial [Candidatus Margulisiibacteriota bacterium]
VFVTGHEDPDKSKSLLDWESIASQGTIVLYMAVENLSGIVDKLVSAGKPKNTPVVIVSNAGEINQKFALGKLNDIAVKAKLAGVIPPAVVIIGKVATLEKYYNWSKKNKRILFTGLSDERFFLGGNYIYLPLIEILPL